MPDWSATLICPTRTSTVPRCCGTSSVSTGDHGAGSHARRCTRPRTASSRRISTAGRCPTTSSAPGWSSYEWRLRYRSYDVTALSRPDLGARRRARQRLVPRPARLGRRPGLLRRRARRLRPAGDRVRRRPRPDGGHRRELDRRALGRDRPTTCTTGRPSTPAGTPTPGWSPASPATAGPASTGRAGPATLTPYIGPPVRRQEELRPVRIWTSPAGKTLVDFGQNLVGWVRSAVPDRPAPDHPAARRGARARRTRRPARCAPPRPPTGSS